jgi:Spy/CpxP family protein refolding chaperone
MKLNTFFKITILATTLFIGSNVFAQDVKTDEQQPQNNQPAVDNKITLLRHLGLTREQIQQIRRINAERKPLMDAAQQRLKEATKQLDDAIYADNVAEGEFQERLKNVQLAQAEVSRIRFANEFAIRRVLTPEQLVKFCELRDRFEAAKQNMQNQQRERVLNRQNQTDVRPQRNNDQNLRRVIRQQPQPTRPPAQTRPQ